MMSILFSLSAPLNRFNLNNGDNERTRLIIARFYLRIFWNFYHVQFFSKIFLYAVLLLHASMKVLSTLRYTSKQNI